MGIRLQQICCFLLFTLGVSSADVTTKTVTNVKANNLLPKLFAERLVEQLKAQLPGATVWRLKGDRALGEVNHSTGIIDYKAETVTLMDVPNKTFLTVPLAGLTAMALTQASTLNQPSSRETDGLKFDTEVRKTQRTETLLGIQTEETVVILDIDAPNAPTLGGRIKIELHFWLAAPAEIQHFPALKELAAFSLRAKSPHNALELVEKIVAPFPGLGDSVRVPMSKILRASGPPLKVQVLMFSPVLKQITDVLILSKQKLPPGADLSGPLATITMEMTDISDQVLEEALFQIPTGFEMLKIGPGTEGTPANSPSDTEIKNGIAQPNSLLRPSLKRDPLR
jgi:hypothetical protein